MGSAQAFPSLASGKGRVFLYRTSTIGSTFKLDTSDVLLNGEKVGKFIRPGVYFKDVLTGSYAVTTTMTAKVAFFHVDAGEKKYVKFDNDFFGSVIYPELVEPAKGEAEASNLNRLGQ
jgi:hypothetical protein